MVILIGKDLLNNFNWERFFKIMGMVFIAEIIIIHCQILLHFSDYIFLN